MQYLGDFAEDATVRYYLTTNDSNGAPVAPSSAFEAADFIIYKDGSATQKTSVNGITMTSPFDALTGLHLLEIDTSNDTGDAGFWVTGSDYIVVASPDETVDSQSVRAALFQFSIENRYDSQTGDSYARLGAPAGASVSADIAAIAADQKPKKNTALSNIGVYMVSSTDHVSPATGLTPTVEISKDGGAFAAKDASSTIGEVSDGLYQIDLVAADMNADVVIIKVTGTGADPVLLSISTVD
jgi:hypothetical protein